MTPIRFDGFQNILGQPANWDTKKHGACGGLPVHYDGTTFFSCWRPSWKQRLKIFFGGAIFLWVFGDGHPPVMLDAGHIKKAKA